MKHRFYFPVPLENAVALLRRECRLDQAHGCSHKNIIGYTDRDQAISRARASRDENASKEVCLVVVECREATLLEILYGDFTHYGPSAHWLTDQTLELEHIAQERLSHDGRFSLEIVKG